MNTKTTLVLAIVLLSLGGYYFYLRSRPIPATAEADSRVSAAASSTTTSRDLLEEKLGDVVKIVYQRKGKAPWTFEKQKEAVDAASAAAAAGGPGTWHMTAPIEMKCVPWEVTKYATRLGSLQYDLSYSVGAPGVISPAAAGLEPAEAEITLTDANGRTATVEIGLPASNRTTYVRIAGSDKILVGKADLKDLIKDSPLDYRDKLLWTFKTDDVTRLEIEDRSESDTPVSYVFFRDGARWMMESPVTGRATNKVDEAVRALSNLRVMQWIDDDSAKLSGYGLNPAAWTLRITVAEEVPVADDANDKAGDGASENEPETRTERKTTVHVLHLSNQSPLGEDTKTYLRNGDEAMVATLWKSQADKLKPDLSRWRDRHVTPVAATSASRIELTAESGSAVLARTGSEWTFEPDGGRAEEAAVTDLLKAVEALEAVAYVNAEPGGAVVTGLDSPRATLRLTVPGVEGIEQIAVGAFTDEQAKRLVYVRRNDVPSIAKVRSADVEKLLQGPAIYRDRTVVDVLPSRFERITLTILDPSMGYTSEVALHREGNAWSMIEPVHAEVKEAQVDKLVEGLGGLRAERVVAEQGQDSAYGLHAPTVTVALTYRPASEFGAEQDSESDAAENEASVNSDATDASASAVADESADRTITLLVTEHDGKYYAKRTDRPTIYEIPADFYGSLRAEYHDDRVVDFDAANVARFTIRDAEESYTFERQDDKWIFTREPDLPLDAKKVENLLLQLRDLRTNRYVRYRADDLAVFGLADPTREVLAEMDGGVAHRLLISDRTGSVGKDTGNYATVAGVDGVFLLTPDTLQRIHVSLDDLEDRS